jgi:hypothetical protein
MRLIPYAGSPVLNAAGTNGNGTAIPADLSIPEFMRRGAAAQEAVNKAIAEAETPTKPEVPKPTGKSNRKGDRLPVPPPSAKADRKPKSAKKAPPKPKRAAKDAAKPKGGAKVARPAKAAQRAPQGASDGPRAGSKTALVADLLARKEGCTTADVLKATGWPAVSLPAMAKAIGVKLRKEKDGKVSRYWAA